MSSHRSPPPSPCCLTRTPRSSRPRSARKKAARALGRDILVVQAGTAPELEAAFATISRARPGALLVGGGAFSPAAGTSRS